MSLTFKAAAPFHWFGTSYAEGDSVDTTGYDSKAVMALLHKAPVYVSEGGGSSAVREYVFPFAYNTPGLAAGVVAYTPTIGDTLENGWIEIVTAWDGTTPYGDFGPFLDGGGYYYDLSYNSFVIDMTVADSVSQGIRLSGHTSDGSGMTLAQLGDEYGATLSNHGLRIVPATFATADPIKVVVSQNGSNTGAVPGATQGAARLHLKISTPTTSPG